MVAGMAVLSLVCPSVALGQRSNAPLKSTFDTEADIPSSSHFNKRVQMELDRLGDWPVVAINRIDRLGDW
jgi:hypothetical protein